MNDATKQILKELVAKTTSGKLSWEKGSQENQLVLRLASGTLRVAKRDNDIEPTGYSATIYNKAGFEVESVFDDEPLTADSKILKELWDAAYESFFKVNETLRNILGELKGPKGLLD